MKNFWIKYSYLFTISFFFLGFFNLGFAMLGFICLIMPFFFVKKDSENTWCKSYCPRANILTHVFIKRGINLKVPKFLFDGRAKNVMLIYFFVNIFMIVISTLMVFMDKRDPVEMIRFLIAFQLPWHIPQLINVDFVSDWVIHLSYRIYSMMFSTTILGLLLGLLYRPRTWCTICPMGTLTNDIVKRQNIVLNIKSSNIKG